MKKLFIVLTVCYCAIGLFSCTKPLDPDDVAMAVFEGEQKRLPLQIQEANVENITIDSIVMVCTVEPMSAYLYTTWSYSREEQVFDPSFHYVTKHYVKSAIVPISNIQRCENNKDMIEWCPDWRAARRAAGVSIF